MKKSLMFALCLGLMAPLSAAVKVSWYKITFTDVVSDGDVRAGNRQYRKRMFPYERLCVVAQNVDAASLALLARSYPDVTRFEVWDCPWLTDLTSLKPLTKLKSLTISQSLLPEFRRRTKPLDVSALDAFANLESLSLQGLTVPDVTPVGRCSTLKSLDFRFASLPDLSPLEKLANVREISFHGATLSDFSPLAGLRSLESVDYSSAKVPADKWSTLGALRQVKSFRGGLTKMTSLVWVRDVPQIESLSLFGEEIRDYAPVATAKRLKTFKASGMRTIVDVSFVRECPALEEVSLSSCWVRHLDTLRAVPSIRVLDLSELKSECDLSFVTALKNLETLSLDRSRVKGFDFVKGLPNLHHLSLLALANGSEVNLRGLQACPRLESVTVARGAFSALEIDDVTHFCQKNVTRFKFILK